MIVCAVSGVGLAAPAAVGTSASRIAVIGDSYTAGSDEGGNGRRAWPELLRGLLARGDGGSVFEDLTARAVRRSDALIVFFGSRNDQPVDPQKFPALAADTFQLARFAAPGAKVLVIGPPWPTASPSPEVLKIRDSLRDQATAFGAVFADPIAQNWFVDREDLIGQDGVHPTDAGHAYMAAKIAPLIYAQLTIRV
jgi:lysophospholipase L1-like esterase